MESSLLLQKFPSANSRLVWDELSFSIFKIQAKRAGERGNTNDFSKFKTRNTSKTIK